MHVVEYYKEKPMLKLIASSNTFPNPLGKRL